MLFEVLSAFNVTFQHVFDVKHGLVSGRKLQWSEFSKNAEVYQKLGSQMNLQILTLFVTSKHEINAHTTHLLIFTKNLCQMALYKNIPSHSKSQSRYTPPDRCTPKNPLFARSRASQTPYP